MKPYFSKHGVEVYHGDNRDILGVEKIANTFDSCITDPPYGLRFMGKKWDYDIPGPGVWMGILDSLKPGAHLLSFFGTRTYHRGACAIEDAGFEIRDQIGWLYGSGFPKSLDVSKAIDKAAGADREIIGKRQFADGTFARDGAVMGQHGRLNPAAGNPMVTAPATEAARQWNGWGTALKPAWEPVVLARKPLIGTVAENVLEHGTGALNIDASRVECVPGDKGEWPITGRADDRNSMAGPMKAVVTDATKGRFPANIIHDGSDEVVGMFPETVDGIAVRERSGGKNCHSEQPKPPMANLGYGGGGSAARFFYSAKADAEDRGEGNSHPTVKPIALMQYLIKLITPPGGLVLDPFAGSGSTLIAAQRAGFRAVGIEAEEKYCEIIARRLDAEGFDFGQGAA